MKQFFKFIYAQNPILILLSMLFLIVLFAYFMANNKKKGVFLSGFLTLFSIFLIACVTVIIRNGDVTTIILKPFDFIRQAQIQPEIYRSFFMNIFLFVPLGIAMPYALSKIPHKRNVFITIGFGAVLSVVIEFLQYYYHLGRCETDDVIANTLGTIIGSLSYLLYIRMLKNREENLMQKNTNCNQKLLLDLCAKSLFDKNVDISQNFDTQEVINESISQTVFPLTYSMIKDKCVITDHKLFSQVVAKNIRVEYAHNEVHNILSKNNITYVVLKGVASAAYYKEPMLRMMGDVDILVSPNDIKKADELLKSIGFVIDDDSDDRHISYIRKDGISCELHRRIGGAPKDESGDIIRKYLADIFEKSAEYKTSNGSCIVPCKFHHAIIILLHTASHLTSTGVGLRHLCDWAVFVNDFSNDEFVALFEQPLKEMGLWRFAQLLTLCCVSHLGCDQKEWAGQDDNNLIDSIVFDILNGGNFGTKDTDRYNQIKYISDRKEGVTAKKNPISQLFVSINEKTKKEFKFVNKSKLFLPIGWIFTVCKYFYLVVVGKRKIDTISTINGAKQRKEIYNEFKLFENDL